METAAERWIAADDDARIYALTFELIGRIAVAFVPRGSTLAAPYFADLRGKLDALAAVKRDAEGELNRALEGDPDDWLRDAWGR